ncbi:MAG: glycosyltransferase [Prevotella sp.]|nr:glycosyltransferase [Prevotella sp.]
MNILINCTNLKAGGGLQVADSICCELNNFPNHHFWVVLSSGLNNTKKKIAAYKNAEVYTYDICNNLKTLLLGRDVFLDSLVKDNQIDAVLTVFGPSRWIPRTKHLCGFARAQLLLTDSPYYDFISFKERLLFRLWTWAFKRSSKCFYTENSLISSMLPQLLGDIKVYTVTNYYNQVFDVPSQWSRTIKLPEFHGATVLSISSNGAWKNMKITADIARFFVTHYPSFQFRFVMTLSEDEAIFVTDDIKEHFCLIGKVDVSECPNLYEQADVMFMPSLMECFTATYPEAMRMEVPIVTTDLTYAHGLCGEAACYYDAMSAKAAADAIYMVATVKDYAQKLVSNGQKQLLKFDNYEQRTEKLISILEEIAEKN